MASAEVNPITLTRFILANSSHFPQATGDFAILLQSIQLACKAIASLTRRIGIANMYGVAGDENASGEKQKKLDVFSNDIFINCLKFSDQVYLMVSEEEEDAIILSDKKSGYCVVFDPLDGSSNIDANISVGTIFGIYHKDPKSNQEPKASDALRPGRELVAAGYAMYGSSTMMVLTTGNGVHGFLLDPAIGEFILTHPDIRMPKKGKVYSINEGNSSTFDPAISEYIRQCKVGPKPKSARYVGSMVADMHRTLLYGGCFCYPGTTAAPSGKLRLLYECNPMAMLIEQAGGRATNGYRRILDIKPDKLHQRSPIFLGSADDVKEIEALYARMNPEPRARL